MKCTEKGYKHYKHPKRGVFSLEKPNGKYVLPGGWESELKEVVIIGEDDNCYVYELRESEQGYWVGEKVVNRKFVLPIGVHKSRLLNWIGTQLQLFNPATL